jgi:hypothetical protein
MKKLMKKIFCKIRAWYVLRNAAIWKAMRE